MSGLTNVDGGRLANAVSAIDIQSFMGEVENLLSSIQSTSLSISGLYGQINSLMAQLKEHEKSKPDEALKDSDPAAYNEALNKWTTGLTNMMNTAKKLYKELLDAQEQLTELSSKVSGAQQAATSQVFLALQEQKNQLDRAVKNMMPKTDTASQDDFVKRMQQSAATAKANGTEVPLVLHMQQVEYQIDPSLEDRLNGADWVAGAPAADIGWLKDVANKGLTILAQTSNINSAGAVGGVVQGTNAKVIGTNPPNMAAALGIPANEPKS
jgi:chromosome segregation ATPase